MECSYSIGTQFRLCLGANTGLIASNEVAKMDTLTINNIKKFNYTCDLKMTIKKSFKLTRTDIYCKPSCNVTNQYLHLVHYNYKGS